MSRFWMILLTVFPCQFALLFAFTYLGYRIGQTDAHLMCLAEMLTGVHP